MAARSAGTLLLPVASNDDAASWRYVDFFAAITLFARCFTETGGNRNRSMPTTHIGAAIDIMALVDLCSFSH